MGRPVPLVHQVVVEAEIERRDGGGGRPDERQRRVRPLFEQGAPARPCHDPEHALVDRQHPLLDRALRVLPRPVPRGVHGDNPRRAELGGPAQRERVQNASIHVVGVADLDRRIEGRHRARGGDGVDEADGGVDLFLLEPSPEPPHLARAEVDGVHLKRDGQLLERSGGEKLLHVPAQNLAAEERGAVDPVQEQHASVQSGDLLADDRAPGALDHIPVGGRGCGRTDQSADAGSDDRIRPNPELEERPPGPDVREATETTAAEDEDGPLSFLPRLALSAGQSQDPAGRPRKPPEPCESTALGCVNAHPSPSFPELTLAPPGAYPRGCASLRRRGSRAVRMDRGPFMLPRSRPHRACGC